MPERRGRPYVRMSRCVRPHVHGMYKMQSIVTALQFSDRVRLRVDLTIVLLAPPPLCLSLTHHLGIRRPVVSHCVFAYCVGSSASRARLQWDWAFKKFHIEEAT